jgi:hypothetical protein
LACAHWNDVMRFGETIPLEVNERNRRVNPQRGTDLTPIPVKSFDAGPDRTSLDPATMHLSDNRHDIDVVIFK